MGFSIWLADDPELAALDAALESSQEPEVEGSDYPGFSVNSFAWRDLCREMEAQGMLAFIPLRKLEFNNGDHVTADEIAGALSAAASTTLTGDEELTDLWTRWLEFLRVALEHDGIRVH